MTRLSQITRAHTRALHIKKLETAIAMALSMGKRKLASQLKKRMESL